MPLQFTISEKLHSYPSPLSLCDSLYANYRLQTQQLLVIVPSPPSGLTLRKRAAMATSLQQPTSRPLPDFATSPPDQAFFNMPNPPQQSTSNRNMNGNHDTQHRLSTDFKGNDTATYTNGNGPVPVPNGLPHPIPNGTSRHRNTVSMGAFEGPRSPSNTKSVLLHPTMRWARKGLTRSLSDTSHVPCKFFRTGQCQAGKACPFSHSTDLSPVDTPCKYFAKVWQAMWERIPTQAGMLIVA